MPRYIDADAIHYVEIGNGVEIALASDIDKMPTISTDEVRGVGEWEESEYSGYLRCSACKDCHVAEEYFSEHYAKWRYCPSCGARMSRAEAEKAMEVSGDA